MTLLNPYMAGGLIAGFLLYSVWMFQQGREFEQGRQAAAIAVVNGKIKVVVERETMVAMKEDALAAKAHAEATVVLAKSEPCLVTEEEAVALARIR